MTRRLARSIVALALTALTSGVAAELPRSTDTGWHTWRVAAIDTAASWCCGHWSAGQARTSACNLARSQARIVDVSLNAPPAEIQVYVQLGSSGLVDIRAYDSRCRIDDSMTFRDHGLVDVDASVAWLEPHVRSQGELGTSALMAIAAHAGPAAERALRRFAAAGNPPATRKDALFWIGQLRIADLGDVLVDTLYRDDDPLLRQHAIFAYSQSDAGDRVDVLARAGRTDEDPDVRGEAWFWLAQTGLDDARRPIERAIAAEPDGGVRETAIFALAQLPDNGGIAALLNIVSNRELPQSDRERALFWLAQSEAPDAWQYLDTLLTR